MFVAVRWVLGAQIIVASIAAFFAMILGDMADANAALLGGLSALLPNLYFAVKFGFHDPKKTPQQIVRNFYVSELIKLGLTAAIFIIVVQLPEVRFIPMFATFIAMMAVFWFALLVRSTNS